MTAPNSVDVAAVLRQQVAEGHPDVLRTMVAAFANALMSADADAICGADYGQRSDDRSNRRNGYRAREWDTRAGTVELQIPKLRQGSYFPDWLLTHRRRAEQALVTVVATSYLLGVSTRRVEKLAEQLGVTRLSKSQVSEPSTGSFRRSTICWTSRVSVFTSSCGSQLSESAWNDPDYDGYYVGRDRIDATNATD